MKKKEIIIDIVIALAIVALVAGYFMIKNHTTTPTTTPKVTGTVPNVFNNQEITITTKTIKENNFSGSMPVISGSNVLATTAKQFVDKSIADFKTQADKDVPDMRKQFGKDSPTANYSIDMKAEIVKGSRTESVVVSTYAYTGGANGNSTYKVFTSMLPSGKIISLNEIIKADKKDEFTAFVEKQLLAWAPEGTTAPVVFPDSVAGLVFDYFSNWSMDDQNLILYFDKYEIGPGVLGPIAFKIPISSIKDLMK